MTPPEFEWDATKADENFKKHGVSFQEALTVFADPLARIFGDPDHSAGERRELVVGHSAQQHLLVVSFTERASRTRITSAREATVHERRDYEENSHSVI
ncbi:MAG: BrnT family toxin [Vicinamibacterales bacterium]